MVYQNGDLEELKRRTRKLKGQRNMSFIAYHVSYLASLRLTDSFVNTQTSLVSHFSLTIITISIS